MRCLSFLVIATLLVSLSGITLGASEDLVISEFMADNESSLADEDLYYYPGWVEIFNAGTSPVNLAGWHLTDSTDDLLKWEFPGKEINPGEFLVVFCSGKDRRDPASELHTNFKLMNEGEYLGLIAPDGTIASEYRPFFPPQETDISYGLKMESESNQLLGPGNPATISIPSDDSLGLTWTETGFDDSAWIHGSIPVGYDRKTSSSYDDIISTDIELKMRGVNSVAFIRIPFEVTGISDFNFVKLTVQYDDGFVAYMNGTEIGRVNSPDELKWNSRAAATKSSTSEIIFSGDLLNQGQNVLSFFGLNRSTSNIDFLIAPTLEAVTILNIDRDKGYYFTEPTPGTSNAEGFPAIAKRPKPSRPPGGYVDDFLLSFETDSPDAEIRYTLNRTIPDETSTLYTDPILINKTITIRARTFQPGLIPSPVKTYCYMKIDSRMADFDSNLPIMVINQFGSSINDSIYASTHVFVFDKESGRNSITDFNPFNCNAGIKIRGSSSTGFPKKMYALELWNENQREYQKALMGLPSKNSAGDSDWVLYAPYSDKSLMRNVLSYQWSNDMGRYAPRTQFFELFMNPSTGALRYPTNYMGVYVLVEKIKREHERLNIKPLYASENSEPGISGGYILKNDRLDPGDVGLKTSRGKNLAYVYPKERQNPLRPPQKVITAEQKVWIKGYLDHFEAALYGGNFKDPVNGYNKYIDTLSFIDQHILVELAKNIDGYRLSYFMYKDKGGKLNMGPAWDYNLSLGNADYNGGWMPTGWYYNYTNSYQQYPWYPRLFQDPAFTDQYKARWFELRKGPLATEKLLSDVDKYADLIRESQARNFQRWRILGMRVWPNWYIAKTWDEELTWMKGWIKDRVLWMDSQFLSPPSFSSNGGKVDPGSEVTITGAMGDIYYTLNGPDPADPGATPIVYTDPITINANTRIRARIKIGGSWSTMKEATFVTEIPKLVVTEIMYNPGEPPDSSFLAREFEYIEIKNMSDHEISLIGAEFSRGVSFAFADGDITSLAAGEYAVVVRNLEAFSSLYDTSQIKVAGQYTGTLSDRTETIKLQLSSGEEILSFAYSDSWYYQTDGQGYSLVIRDPNAPIDTWGAQSSWRQSTNLYGSPGEEDPPPANGYQIQGDFNQDGRIGIADAINMLYYLFSQGQAINLPCSTDGGNQILLDLTFDGRIDLADAVFLLNYIFNDGQGPLMGSDCTKIETCPDVCIP